jgi:hypothetical protein
LTRSLCDKLSLTDGDGARRERQMADGSYLEIGAFVMHWLGNESGHIGDQCARSSVPNPDHQCGVYGLRLIEDLLSWSSSLFARYPHVLGEVWLWGRVLEGSRGVASSIRIPRVLHLDARRTTRLERWDRVPRSAARRLRCPGSRVRLGIVNDTKLPGDYEPEATSVERSGLE